MNRISGGIAVKVSEIPKIRSAITAGIGEVHSNWRTAGKRVCSESTTNARFLQNGNRESHCIIATAISKTD